MYLDGEAGAGGHGLGGEVDEGGLRSRRDHHQDIHGHLKRGAHFNLRLKSLFGFFLQLINAGCAPAVMVTTMSTGTWSGARILRLVDFCITQL